MRQPPDVTRFLTVEEIRQIIQHLKRAGYRRRRCRRQNLIVFRLSCCCGLRVSEIADLKLGDMTLTGARPAIRVLNGKGGKRRTAPLWWDAGTLQDLRDWDAELRALHYDDSGFVVAAQRGKRRTQLDRRNIAERWKTAIKCLDPQRVDQLSIHCGRHSFISHALAAGRTLAEVRDAVGHGSIATTNIYTHAMGMGADVPDVFAMEVS